MDHNALVLSLELALVTALVLLPLAVLVGRTLAWRRFAGKPLIEAMLALPLVLPPTVLGYYLLTLAAPATFAGAWIERLTGHTLAFSFAGLVVASLVANIPFAMQPVQRGFEAIPQDVREAAALCGMSSWRAFWKVELPLAWPGLVTAFVLTFAHTLGEFGVVLMVGGNIAGETRTLSIAIYDRAQALDDFGAGVMAATLLVISFTAIGIVYALEYRRRRYGGR